MPIFRSQQQAELLTQLHLHPDAQYALSELAQAARVPLSTAHREMARLVDTGLVVSRSVGRTRLYQADAGHPAARALTELLTLTFGPAQVIGEEFVELPEVDSVLLFGSWAARYAGQDGPPPADIDVLIIGTPHRAAVYAAADRAAARLRLPVNPALRTPDQWRAAEDALVDQVHRSSYLTVIQRAANPSSEAAAPPLTGIGERR
ncbi:winged helix-turn-helix domain-containing protein [Modestobacter sp. SSW1-42]|uniref:winged helix-turn-helix domain-containing protein n=1 Tax=Modestobacter sp. SSW1-42 TaxID=596372 RepID=UPI003986893B